jgi:hypothetical protein
MTVGAILGVGSGKLVLMESASIEEVCWSCNLALVYGSDLYL